MVKYADGLFFQLVVLCSYGMGEVVAPDVLIPPGYKPPKGDLGVARLLARYYQTTIKILQPDNIIIDLRKTKISPKRATEVCRQYAKERKGCRILIIITAKHIVDIF